MGVEYEAILQCSNVYFASGLEFVQLHTTLEFRWLTEPERRGVQGGIWPDRAIARRYFEYVLELQVVWGSCTSEV